MNSKFVPEDKARFILLVLLQAIYILIPSVDFLQFRNPTISGKFIAFLFLIEITTLVFFITQLITKKTVSITLIDLLLAAVFGYITLNRYVFQPSYGFSIRYYELFCLAILYMILKSPGNKSFYYSLFIAVVIGANIQLIIGFLQLYGLIKPNNEFLKVTGGFFNSGPYAGYLAAVFPISLYIIKNLAPKNIVRSLLLFNIIGCICLIPVLKSRACYLAIICSIVFIYRNEIVSIARMGIKNKIIKYLSLALIPIAITGAAYFIFTLKKESSEGRFLILKTSSAMLADKPLLGFGYDRFRTNYMNYQAEYFVNHPNKKETTLASNTVYAFNEPLQFSIENGIPGLILLLVAAYYLLKYTNKKSDISLIAQSGLLSVVVFSLFSYPSEILPIKLLFFLYISVLAADYESPVKITLNLQKYIAVILFLSAAGCFYQSVTETLKWTRSYMTWEKAWSDLKNARYTEGEKKLSTIYPVFETNGDFLTDYGLALFLTKNYTQGINVLEQSKKYTNNSVVEATLGNCQKAIRDYTNAEKSYLAASNMTPNSFYNKHLLFALYRENSQNEKAANTAKGILSLEIKVPSEETAQIRNEAKFFLKEHAIPYVE